MRNGGGLACPLCLEGRSIEEPDGQSTDSDDAEEDQGEGDVRLTLGVVLGETVHLTCEALRAFQGRRRPQVSGSSGRGTPGPCGAEGERTPDLMSAIHALSQLSYSPATGQAGCGLRSLTRARSARVVCDRYTPRGGAATTRPSRVSSVPDTAPLRHGTFSLSGRR